MFEIGRPPTVSPLTVFTVGVAVMLGFCGFRTAVAGQPMARSALLEDPSGV